MASYTVELRKVIDLYGRDEVESWFKDYEISDYLTDSQANLIKEAGVVMIAMIVIGRFTGAAAVLTALFTFLYYHVRSENEFGGITGDVAGWFVCICETCMVLVIGAMAYFYRWL